MGTGGSYTHAVSRSLLHRLLSPSVRVCPSTGAAFPYFWMLSASGLCGGGHHSFPLFLTASIERLPQHFHVHVPGSKSVSNRALLLAALCNGPIVVHGLLVSEDTQ